MKKSKKYGIYLLLSIIFIILIFVSIDYTLKKYTNFGEIKTLPTVTGLSYEEAKTMLESEGFRSVISDSLFVEGAKKNEVMEQEPIQESEVKPGRMVYLKVNCMPVPMVLMPDVEEKTLREASSILNNAGLEIGKIIRKPDETSFDYVLEQLYHEKRIREGTKLQKGSVIDLIVTELVTKDTISNNLP